MPPTREQIILPNNDEADIIFSNYKRLVSKIDRYQSKMIDLFHMGFDNF